MYVHNIFVTSVLGDYSSLRYYKQMELPRDKQMAKGGGGTRARHTKGPSGKQITSSFQATGGS